MTTGDRAAVGGLWLNRVTLELRSVPAVGGTLPGAEGDWRRVPGWLVALLAPLVGGAMLLLLPVAGAAAAALGLAQKVLAGSRRIALDLSHQLATPPVAGEAHLTGQPEPGHGSGPAGCGPEAGADPEALGELEEEIRARQASGEKPAS
jgi:hypothetical protein